MAGAGDSTRAARRRRKPEEARAQALISARRLLIAGGPKGVTLHAVAAEIGVTHGNLIHHFGSAEELQSALMGVMVRDLTIALEQAIAQVRADNGPRALVDVVFDAFAQGGAGKLAAWIAVSNRYEHLEPIREAVGDLAAALAERIHDDEAEQGGERVRRMPSALLFIALCAFGDALIGEPLRDMVGRDPDSVRRIVAHLIPALAD